MHACIGPLGFLVRPPDEEDEDEAGIEDASKRILMVRKRSMSVRELIAEAESKEHISGHHPHNPFCRICCLAHMRQQQYANKRDRADDGLTPPKDKNQQLAADTIVVSKSKSGEKVSVGHKTNIFSMRDKFSGRAAEELVQTETSLKKQSPQ